MTSSRVHWRTGSLWGVMVLVVVSLGFAGRCVGQQPRPLPDFSKIYPGQYAPPPQTIVQNGKKYFRVNNSNEYRARDGARIIVDGADFILSRDYLEREQEWEEAVARARQAELPPAAPPRSDRERSEIPAGEGPNIPVDDSVIELDPDSGFFGEGPAEEDPPPPLPKDCTLEVFQQYFGPKWAALSKDCRGRTAHRCGNLNRAERERICEIYRDAHGAYMTLAAEQRARFDLFNDAYRWLVERQDPARASLEMFRTRDGSVTTDYGARFPWICLKYPNVPDRLLIFLHEHDARRNAHGERLNWQNIKICANRYRQAAQ